MASFLGMVLCYDGQVMEVEVEGSLIPAQSHSSRVWEPHLFPTKGLSFPERVAKMRP